MTFLEKSNESITLPSSYKAIIRSILERNSSDSTVFEGKENLFYSVDCRFVKDVLQIEEGE